MKYLKPDPSWGDFDIESFAQYEAALVVKGKFHPLVPAVISEAYLQAEYMMAFGYYHAPLYNEALKNVVQIFEKAITIKCSQLKIGQKGKSLKSLMEMVHLREPGKQLKNHYQVIRILRYCISHPEKEAYMGDVTTAFNRRCNSLLNILFIPEALFLESRKETKKMTKALKQYADELFWLTENESKSLVTSINIKASLFVQGRWIYLLYAVPALENMHESFSKYDFVAPWYCAVGDIILEPDKVTCRVAETQKLLVLKRTMSEETRTKFESQQLELSTGMQKQFASYRVYIKGSMDQIADKFEYGFLQGVV